MNIYIDFFSALPQEGSIKFHGGGNYARSVINQLLDLGNRYIQVIILCPKWFEASNENEPLLYGNENIIWKNVECVSDAVEFEEGSILFYPLLGYLRDLKAIVKIRKKNPGLKICATLHDVRFLQYTVDYTEKYYNCGMAKVLFPFRSFLIDNIMKKSLKRPALKRCLKALDEVYTVSNYSMQQILLEAKKIKISWYYQKVNINKGQLFKEDRTINYILFVSGARPVKNLSHALLGFSQYKTMHPESDIVLMITGIDKETFNNLCYLPNLDKEIIKRDTILLGYVSSEELAKLYTNCRFVLYTSKNEGFGLPVLEAAVYGKTCVSSNIASIPEVIGTAVRYVCPTDDYAIAQEIEYLCDDEKLEKYEKRIADAMVILDQRMRLEQRNFIEDLLEK